MEARLSKIPKFDGLGPREIADVRSAVRLVWQRGLSRSLVVKRCTRADGYTYCEDCGNRTPKFKVDHIVPVGDLDSGFVPRLFVPSKELRGLCHDCHKAKTKAERKAKPPRPRAKRAKKEKYDLGF